MCGCDLKKQLFLALHSRQRISSDPTHNVHNSILGDILALLLCVGFGSEKNLEVQSRSSHLLRDFFVVLTDLLVDRLPLRVGFLPLAPQLAHLVAGSLIDAR